MHLPLTFTLLVTLVSIGSALTPTALRCENRADPIGVEAGAPRLSWQLKPGPGEQHKFQCAYQLIIASSEEKLAANIGDLWDSGKVQSAESLAVRYAGSSLRSLQSVRWKVRIWDEDGQVSDWSAPASWTMGLLSPSDWQGASWIGSPSSFTVLGHAAESATADALKWVQVDLGTEVPLNAIVIRPQSHHDPAAGGWIEGYGFPLRYRVEVSSTADFSTATLVADHTSSDVANPGNAALTLPVSGITARYVRVTATKLWQRGPSLNHVFALAEIEAISASANVALGKTVSASDSYEGSGWSKNHLTDGSVQQPIPQVLRDHPHAAILLRKEFAIKKPVVRALAAVGTVGYSELSLNGKKVGDAQLSPEFTDYRKRVPYVVHDVTTYLADGTNAIGLALANGFAATPSKGYLGWYGKAAPARVLCRLLIEFADGTSQIVGSDNSWKWNIGENTFNDLWVGEKIDNRLAKHGWNQPSYPDSDWSAASILDGPGGTWFARTVAPVRVLETASPTSIDGNLFHFDHVATGWLRLKTSGNAGDTVTVLQRGDFPSGFGQTSSEGKQVGMLCTLKGNGEETFEPKWYFHTIGKTVRVEGLTQPATQDTLTRVSVGIDLPRAGNFECSNAFLNEQYQILLRTQRNYNFDYPMDPTREKTGWSQDVMGMIHTSVYDFDAEEFYWNWWKSMRDTQQANGFLEPVMPQIDLPVPGYNGPWWAGMIVYTPWYLYTYHGERAYLEEAYPAMQAFMRYMASQADADKVVSWGLGEWGEVGAVGGFPSRTEVPITSTCAYYLYATILQRSAEILGHTADAAAYANLAKQIKDGFNRRFLNPSTGQVGSIADTQTAQILPLYLGMIPDDKKQLVLNRLVANIGERNHHASTGFVGTIFLLLGLPEVGQAELAHRIIMQQDFPSWNTLVANGVQMETWNGGQVQMPSLGGPIGAYLYQILGGIRPAEPGFKKVLIQPTPVGDLTFVNTHHDGPYGRITCRWRRENGRFHLDTTIPPNSTATVKLPDGTSHEVGSGKHHFEVKNP